MNIRMNAAERGDLKATLYLLIYSIIFLIGYLIILGSPQSNDENAVVIAIVTTTLTLVCRVFYIMRNLPRRMKTIHYLLDFIAFRGKLKKLGYPKHEREKLGYLNFSDFWLSLELTDAIVLGEKFYENGMLEATIRDSFYRNGGTFDSVYDLRDSYLGIIKPAIEETAYKYFFYHE